VNFQSKSVAAILTLLIVPLSALTILTLSISTAGLTVPLLLSGTALGIAVVAYASILVPELKGAPWVPTSRKLVNRILEMAKLKPGELLYDLGSGDGRIVITAAREFGVKTVGIDIDPFRVLYSRFKISQLHLKDKARILRGNFFNVDLRDADVVFLYLEQETNNKLQSKLERELMPDCRVVSLVWKFEGWELVRADEEEMIYVYRPRSRSA
jgi:SAM-dependent methyltransferase